MPWHDKIAESSHKQFFLGRDWQKSILGPLDSWPFSLRLHALATFANSKASCVYWGPERVAVYNEAFSILACEAHPRLMGQPFVVGFPEIWEHIQPIFNMAAETRSASDVNKMELFVRRTGYLEEAFFTGSFIPISDDDLEVGGFVNLVFEVTDVELNARRAAMMNNIAAIPPDLDSKRRGAQIIECLSENPRDVPMALLYSADEDEKPGSCRISLLGTLGLSSEHPLAVTSPDIDSSEGIIPLLAQARRAFREEGVSRIVTTPVDGRFDGVEWRGFGEPSTSVCATTLSSGTRLLGFLVLGMNPRRAVDDALSQQFVRDLTRQLSATKASALSIEEARVREAKLQEELSQTEKQIRYLANHAGVMMQHLRVDGSTIWANEKYYAITGHPRPAPNTPLLFPKLSFIEILHPDDQPLAREKWKELITSGTEVEVELRLKTMFTPPEGDPIPRTMITLAFPYYENGQIVSVMSCSVDVSPIKWQEKWQARNAQMAREAKRQQEEFIDVVSHEARNPLSAMVHLAESISYAAENCLANGPTLATCLDVMHSCHDAAKQILFCAAHQKRIIDDVLILSRLESQMLSMSPTPLQFPSLVNGVMAMFQAETSSHGITTTISPAWGFTDDQRDGWFLADGSRVAQIIVNLLTNAIKFTKDEKCKEITVRYGIQETNPRRAFDSNVRWAPLSEKNGIVVQPLDFGPEELYLLFTISDTGIGMDDQETRRLFERFAQANAKTTIKYGGSGLGLFISRQLAEAQGGSLGVSSTPNCGSTFGFYVRTGRTTQPSDTLGNGAPFAIRTVDPRSDFEASSQLQPSAPTSAGDKYAAGEFNALHIMLVEDNELNAAVLAKRLRTQNCVVYLAGNGYEALDLIRKSDLWRDRGSGSMALDVILMDVEMPEMDGLQATREIRRLEAAGEITKHIEIIATTANARREQLDSAIEAGMDTVLPKPFLIADLMKHIHERMNL